MKNIRDKVRLLLVDDEVDFLDSTRRALERRGIEVRTATNGADAIDLTRSHKFDVMVLDLKMPGMDGMQVFEEVRRERPDLPIIMLTGHGTIDHAFQTSKRGIFDFIPKPCDPDALALRIYEANEEAHKRRGKEKKDRAALEPKEPIQVLLVDDEIELLDSLSGVLKRRNMEVLTASDGKTALDILREAFIEIVVLDIKMPGMDGLEVLKIIKDEHENIEVILLTGHPTIATALQGINMGAFKYLEKPPEIDELTLSIREAYQQRQEKIEKHQQKMIDDIKRRYPD